MGGSDEAPVLYCYPEYSAPWWCVSMPSGARQWLPSRSGSSRSERAVLGEPLPIKTEWRFDGYDEALRFPEPDLRVGCES